MTLDPARSLDGEHPMIAGAPTRYRLTRRLGRGGMAEVFLATMQGAEGFARQVAVKVIREDYAQSPAFCQALTEEARLAAALNHSNVVSVFDYNCDATGRPFLVMEYVDGIDLAQVIGARSPVPFSVTSFLLGEVLRGLGHAHAPRAAAPRGLVHRDLSPQNVLLSREGAVKLSDFGIAKALTSSGVADLLVGKAAYMAPEQVRQEPLDPRSDLFAAGVVLWELLAGRPLFHRASARLIFEQILFEPIRRPRQVRPEVPQDLEAVAMRLLAPHREHRYQRAEDALAELVACRDMPRNGPAELAGFLAARPGRSASVSSPERVTQTLPPPDGDPPIERAPLAERRRRAALWAALGTIVLVAGFLAAMSFRKARTKREGAPVADANSSLLAAPVPEDSLPGLPAPAVAPVSKDPLPQAEQLPEVGTPPTTGRTRSRAASRTSAPSGFVEIPLHQGAGR